MLLFGLMLASCRDHAINEKRAWALPNFMMMDGGKDAAQLHIDGTLIGDDLAYKVNTMALDCMRDEKICRVADVQEIGRDHLGRISVTDWPVVLWSDTTIVAQG